MGCVFVPCTLQVGNIRGHGGPINKLTFSPSGQELITASDDHKVKVSTGACWALLILSDWLTGHGKPGLLQVP